MKHKKIFLSVVFIFVGLAVFAEEGLAQFWRKSDVVWYSDLEDLHIKEKIQYEQSPFNTLIESAFSEKTDADIKNVHYTTVITSPKDALLARVHLIRSAKKAIYIQTNSWFEDESGLLLAAELVKAARRGVKVKVIVDRWISEKKAVLPAYLIKAHPDILIKHYNPSNQDIDATSLASVRKLSSQFSYPGQRMHNKVFIVDDRIAIVSSRNIGNPHFGWAKLRNYKDRDLLVVGPVVFQMTESFMRYWAFKLSINTENIIDTQFFLEDQEALARLKEEIASLQGLLEAQLQPSNDVSYIREKFIYEAAKVENIKFVADQPGKSNKFGLNSGGIVDFEFNGLLSKTKTTILGQTPYFVLSPKEIEQLRVLTRKNRYLEVKVSTNSLASADSIYCYALEFDQKKMFLTDFSVQIFELKPSGLNVNETASPLTNLVLEKEDFPFSNARKDNFDDENQITHKNKYVSLNASTFVIDEKIVWLGAYARDPLSKDLNTRAAIIVWDKKLANLIAADISKDISSKNSWTIAKRTDVNFFTEFQTTFQNFLNYVPFIDVWPFRYTGSFELKSGADVLPYYHEDFYDNYTFVGPFPEIDLSKSEIETQLLKAYSKIPRPLF